MITVEKENLAVRHCVSKDKTKMVLMQVHLDGENKFIEACDGHIVARAPLNCNGETEAKSYYLDKKTCDRMKADNVNGPQIPINIDPETQTNWRYPNTNVFYDDPEKTEVKLLEIGVPILEKLVKMAKENNQEFILISALTKEVNKEDVIPHTGTVKTKIGEIEIVFITSYRK